MDSPTRASEWQKSDSRFSAVPCIPVHSRSCRETSRPVFPVLRGIPRRHLSQNPSCHHLGQGLCRPAAGTWLGGGSGGGATLEPVAFLVVSDKEVKLISLKERETVWEKILSPEVGEKVYNKIMGIAKESNVENAEVTKTSDSEVSTSKVETEF